MIKLLNNPVIAVLLLFLLLAVGFLLLNIATESTMDRVEWEEEAYRVRSGDSLWAIASDYCPDEVDRREWIDVIQRRNHLSDSIIYPGQTITVLAVKEVGAQ